MAVAAAFGGWGLYRADLFRSTGSEAVVPLKPDRGSDDIGTGRGRQTERNYGAQDSVARGQPGCRHMTPESAVKMNGQFFEIAPGLNLHNLHLWYQVVCEHVWLSKCIVDNNDAILVIATDLVVNWGGCNNDG